MFQRGMAKKFAWQQSDLGAMPYFFSLLWKLKGLFPFIFFPLLLNFINYIKSIRNFLDQNHNQIQKVSNTFYIVNKI